MPRRLTDRRLRLRPGAHRAADRTADGADGRHDPDPHPGPRPRPRRRDAGPRLGLRLQHRWAPSPARSPAASCWCRCSASTACCTRWAPSTSRPAPPSWCSSAARGRRRPPAAQAAAAAASARLRGLRRRRAARRLRDDGGADGAESESAASRFGASHFTFAMVVAVFVLCIALGSFAVSALPRIPRAADRRLPVAARRLAGAALLPARRRALLRPRAALAVPRRERRLLPLLRGRLPLHPRSAGRPDRPLRRAASAALPPPAPTSSATSARSRDASTAGTPSARCSGRCSAATRCCSGSIFTRSTGSPSAPCAVGAGLLTWKVLRAPAWLGTALCARDDRRARRCCRPGTRIAWRRAPSACGSRCLVPIPAHGPSSTRAFGPFKTIFYDDDPTSTVTVREA